MNNKKFLSIVIPTLNSEKLLPLCLDSIRIQNYPQESVEIIIADGGSTDGTLEVAKAYRCRIIPNLLKTGEAGKAVGVKHANGEIIALIDSDNILPDPNWLKLMIAPFSDLSVVGTEPLYYTHRKTDGYITRYSALLGANDPLCVFLGNYDRYSLLTNRWTDMPVKEEDYCDYLIVEFQATKLPTIGANGFFVRKNLLDKCIIQDYFFDIDIVYDLVSQGHNKFAKVKIGIIHIFSGTLNTFIRKQERRIRDYGYYQKIGIRRYPWSKLDRIRLIKYVVYTITIFPLLFQAAIGWTRKRDVAWAFHIPACWITLMVYGIGTVRNFFGTAPMERDNWK